MTLGSGFGEERGTGDPESDYYPLSRYWQTDNGTRYQPVTADGNEWESMTVNSVGGRGREEKETGTPRVP